MRQTAQAKQLQHDAAFMKEPITGDGTWVCRRFSDPKAHAKADKKAKAEKWWNGRIHHNPERPIKPITVVHHITEEYKQARYAEASAKEPITGDGTWLSRRFSDPKAHAKAAKHAGPEKWNSGRIHHAPQHDKTEYERITYLNEKNHESFSYLKK